MKRPPGNAMLERARGLRREMTPQEEILWRHLRGRRFEGYKFRRQMWLCGFVADFACPDAQLVVEADAVGDAESRRGLAGRLNVSLSNEHVIGAS